MTITEERFLDASEPDAEGSYEFYYSGVNYKVSDERGECLARMYDDEADRVSLIRVFRSDGTRVTSEFTRVPNDDAFFCDVVKAFVAKGFTRVFLMTSGQPSYVPLDVEQYKLKP